MKKKANEQPQSPSNRPEHKRKFEVTAEAHLPGRGRFSIAKFFLMAPNTYPGTA